MHLKGLKQLLAEKPCFLGTELSFLIARLIIWCTFVLQVEAWIRLRQMCRRRVISVL